MRTKNSDKKRPKQLAVSPQVHAEVVRLCERRAWYIKDFVERVLRQAVKAAREEERRERNK